MINSFSQDAVKDESVQSVPIELDSLSQATMQLRLGLTGHLEEILSDENY